MTFENIIWVVLGIIFTAIVTVIGTKIAQVWGNKEGKTEKLIKEHEEREEKSTKEHENRIERELNSLENAIKNLENLIHEVRNFVAKQSEKNDFATQQFGLLWDKHNENRKEIDDVKNRVSELEHKDKYGKSRKDG